MEIKHTVVGWFEIPVTDKERAIKFYEYVFGFGLSLNEMDLLDMAIFLDAEGNRVALYSQA